MRCFHNFKWLLVSVWTGLVVIFAPLFFPSCSPRIYPTERTDSVRVEIRERIVHDTAYAEITREVERIITRDTLSHLQNDYAISEARVDSLGFLHHSLESRPQYIAVPYTVAVHDTTVVERQAETVVKEVNILTRAQHRWIGFGKICAGLLAGLLLALVVWVAAKIYLRK